MLPNRDVNRLVNSDALLPRRSNYVGKWPGEHGRGGESRELYGSRHTTSAAFSKVAQAIHAYISFLRDDSLSLWIRRYFDSRIRGGGGGEFLRSRDNRAEKARGRPSLDSVPLTRGVHNRSSPRIRSVIHRCDRKQVVGGVFVSIVCPESVVSLHVRGDGVAVDRLFRENRAGSYF